ncbi:DUF2442 domain-containing protein [Saccharobesus litoralis]|uniref:DUF2442 domain-containing protein n=1 Tax=Saccharobesus litoralis TaxID=2172099 RepID=A0A2S0VVD6_9ALTE|nr:DUF2442 domain-containing protein [Saccharobesus litoralis]AWB68070.1 DUF2442 domain-containing protein [Saccharobesus litoralis]
MNPRVISVEAVKEHILKISFENDEVKLFDVSPFLDKGIFKELQDYNYLKQASVAFGCVEWPHEQDFSNDTLYLLSTPLGS